MQVYKILYRPKGTTINDERRILWVGAGGQANREYRRLVGEVGKTNVTKPEPENIPTTKPGLLVWLNENLVAVD